MALSDEQWQLFLLDHPELQLEFTDEELLEALDAAGRTWDEIYDARTHLGWAFSSCVAAQLTLRPTKSEVGRVAARLRKLERLGLVRCHRPRFAPNRWALAHCSE